MDVKKLKKDKLIFILSLIIFLYFALLILIYKLKYDAVIIGVFREILTIPFMVLLAITLILSVVTFIKLKFSTRSYSFYSIFILLLTILLMVVFA